MHALCLLNIAVVFIWEQGLAWGDPSYWSRISALLISTKRQFLEETRHEPVRLSGTLNSMTPFKPQLRLSLFKSIMVLFERAYPSFSGFVVGECCLQQSLPIVISAERKSFTARLIFDPLTSFCICCVIYTFFHVLSSYFSVSLTKTAPFSSIYLIKCFLFQFVPWNWSAV